MQLSDIIRPESVKLLSGTTSKKRLFHEIGDLAASTYGLDADTVIEALMERESLGPTGVGQGVALPHARIDSVGAVCGLFIRLDRPLDFESKVKRREIFSRKKWTVGPVLRWANPSKASERRKGTFS